MRKISVDYLDGLWVEVIRLMYCHACARCSHLSHKVTKGHDAHHVIQRADKRHRWHPLNGVFLCRDCHDWAHAHPVLFKKWLKRNLPHIHQHIRKPNESGYNPRDREQIKAELKEYRSILERNLRGPQQHISKRGHACMGPSMGLNILIIAVLLLWMYMTDGGK
jgi:hypothetical protein